MPYINNEVPGTSSAKQKGIDVLAMIHLRLPHRLLHVDPPKNCAFQTMTIVLRISQGVCDAKVHLHFLAESVRGWSQQHMGTFQPLVVIGA